MKRLTWLVFVVFSLAFVPMLSSQVPAFAGGDGTPANPYQITDCSQLQQMNNYLSASFVLINDIDCSDTINWNSGAGFVPIGGGTAFSGTFDGQNHKITNLFINMPSTNNVGLFGVIGYDLGRSPLFSVKNVGLINVNIKGNFCVGGLVGTICFGVIKGSYATGSVIGGYYTAGGLVGWCYGSTIIDSYAAVNVTGAGGVGGLVGNLYNGGGLTNSYATGSVSGGSCVGGLVGNNERGYGTIEHCYATGSVNQGQSGGGYGGLVGCGNVDYTPNFAMNSYWDTETSGQSISAGGTGVTGKTTAEMKQQATFVDWDFGNLWKIKNGVSYPYFAWQIPPAGVDTIPPVIAAHEDVIAEVIFPAGAVVNYVPPTATDDSDESVTVICTPAPGSTFALGDTTVTCQAEDTAGNQAIPTSFIVHVADTTAPTIYVSDPECGTYGNGNGRKKNKITVTAQDNCSKSIIPQITKVEVFNKGGNLVMGNGIYEISGNIVYVKPGGAGWSVRITAIAADGNGNTQTIQITKSLIVC